MADDDKKAGKDRFTPARPTSEWNPGTADGDPDSGAAQIGTRAAGETEGPAGGEQNVQMTGDAGGSPRGQSAGSGAPVGGSADFLAGSSGIEAAKSQQRQPGSHPDAANSNVETSTGGAGSAPGSLGTGTYGGSVTDAGGSSDVPGAGAAGTEPSDEGGFIASKADDEDGRGERKANEKSDVEGSSSTPR